MSDGRVSDELVSLCKQLLDSIDQQDWANYAKLCDASLTAYEPEAKGHLVAGMDFHKFYFDMESSGRASQSTISAPSVRLMGDVAVVTYVRLKQVILADGSPDMFASEETRVWQKQSGKWQHVHFHRSLPAT